MMVEVRKSDPFEADAPQLGRRTVRGGQLSANRDAILGILCAWWPHIGWQLTTARAREELRQALEPVKDHPNRQYIDRLLRPTNVAASPPKIRAREIREKRLALGQVVKHTHDAQTKHSKCATECQELERAMSQARPDQTELIERELSKRKAEFQRTQDQLTTANATQKMLEEELLDKEAAFAQDQVLAFIGEKRKYALTPVNLANAMAGLPYGIDVPFLGVWQSHARCSKLDSSMLPSFHYEVFNAIESILERSKGSPLSLLEFFQQEIKVLPKTILLTHPTMGSRRVDNYTRTHLCENWWYLQCAIEKSQKSTDDPRPMHFVIAANFDKLLGEPRTYADSAIAKAASICK
jgi:hypothetical protein